MNSRKSNLWALIMSRGFFPEELPPCFTTRDLEKVFKDPQFDQAVLEPQKDENGNKKNMTGKLIPFSIPRVKSHRRMLGVPSPYHYARLTKCLIENIEEVQAIFRESDLSIFKFHQEQEDKRFIPKPDFSELVEARILRSAGFKYALSIDVTRFYPSIYTHSIPWAIHGKAFAKDKAHRGMNYFGNALDAYCREAQDQQTLGIPIGPDASRIISELILSAVDGALRQSLVNVNYKGVRNVDDYHLYFSSMANLEIGRSKIEKALRTYELDLNIAKERVAELPEIIDSEWRTSIRAFQFRKRKDLERTDLIAYFDLCTMLARRFPEENVTSYSIGKLKGLQVRPENWRLLQAFLFNCLVLESKSIELVVRRLLRYREDLRYTPDKSLVLHSLNAFLQHHLEHEHHFEVIWVLWYYLKEAITVDLSLAQMLSKSSNDFIILLTRELNRQQLLEGHWTSEEIGGDVVDNASLQSENWLLAYQVGPGRELGYNDPFFDLLAEQKVNFFQPAIIRDESNTVEVSGASLAVEETGSKADGFRRFLEEEDDDEISDE